MREAGYVSEELPSLFGGVAGKEGFPKKQLYKSQKALLESWDKQTVEGRKPRVPNMPCTPPPPSGMTEFQEALLKGNHFGNGTHVDAPPPPPRF